MKKISRWLKKYFIPHQHNDFKPHLLRHEASLFLFLIIILVEFGFLVQVFVIFDKTNFLATVLPGVLTKITNEERAENDAPPLVQNDLLNKAAQLKAEDMAARGYFAHTSPDGISPWYWFEKVGYHYKMAGENLAVNFFESDDVAKAWMNSPTHRSNIVKKAYTEIGIGVASGKYQGRNTVFVAQLFGTPIKVLPEVLPEVAPAKVAPKATPTQTKTQVSAPTPVATKILGEEVTSQPTIIEKITTSPRHYVTYVLGGISLVVLLALFLFLWLSKIKHPPLILRGTALVAIVILLLLVNQNGLALKTKVSTSDLGASTINILAD